MVQLSHPYTTTRKTIALSVRTIVGKVRSLIFNMLSRFVTAFLPRSKCLFMTAGTVILELKKIKTITVSIFPPYADDTTLTAESEEELKSFLMRVKEESEKAGLKLNIRKTKIMASGHITSWQIDGETVEQ